MFKRYKPRRCLPTITINEIIQIQIYNPIDRMSRLREFVHVQHAYLNWNGNKIPERDIISL